MPLNKETEIEPNNLYNQLIGSSVSHHLLDLFSLFNGISTFMGYLTQEPSF